MELDKFEQLAIPLELHEVEWRILMSGKKNNKIWGKAIAFIDARAGAARLDRVFGPQNWKKEYKHIQDATGKIIGVICRVYIRLDEDSEWVWKEDGAEQTEIEPFKGGLSDAFKRACGAWGIGKELYKYEAIWVDVCDQYEEGAKYGKDKKSGEEFGWKINPNKFNKIRNAAISKTTKATGQTNESPKPTGGDEPKKPRPSATNGGDSIRQSEDGYNYYDGPSKPITRDQLPDGGSSGSAHGIGGRDSQDFVTEDDKKELWQLGRSKGWNGEQIKCLISSRIGGKPFETMTLETYSWICNVIECQTIKQAIGESGVKLGK